MRNELKGDVRAEQATQHFGDATDHFVKVHVLRLHLLFPAKRKQLASQIGGAFCCSRNLLKRFFHIVTFNRDYPQDFTPAQGDQII